RRHPQWRGAPPGATQSCGGRSERSRGLLRWHGDARQRNARPQARRIVLKLELAALKPSDGGDQAQAQPGTWQRTALLKAHKAIEDAGAVALWNAGAAIANREHDSILLGVGLDQDSATLAIDGT